MFNLWYNQKKQKTKLEETVKSSSSPQLTHKSPPRCVDDTNDADPQLCGIVDRPTGMKYGIGRRE
jgi:hypothetical protein